MSFEPNDNMNTIHLDNYEEFFVLYMDKELSNEQVKMVDDFLAANPDLKTEFEMLMVTKLPLEEFSFDKKDLLAENMKLTSVGEELLLYIDNELPSDKKKTVEIELASSKDYQLQHQVLLQTKLDPSEKIEYPNKKELYHRTERVISMKVWMRVAAAVVIVAVGGVFYFKDSSPTVAVSNPQTTVDVKRNPVQPNDLKKNKPANSVTTPSNNSNDVQVAVIKPSKKEIKPNKNIEQKQKKDESIVPQNAIAYTPQETRGNEIERPTVKSVQFEGGDNTIASINDNSFLNTNNVTSLDPNRTTIQGTPDNPDEPSDRKGSIKGFLRKATRMIEKRTGIDPTNDNGQLLIGAVAINLK